MGDWWQWAHRCCCCEGKKSRNIIIITIGEINHVHFFPSFKHPRDVKWEQHSFIHLVIYFDSRNKNCYSLMHYDIQRDRDVLCFMRVKSREKITLEFYFNAYIIIVVTTICKSEATWGHYCLSTTITGLTFMLLA